ncbi:iron ABC transporter ATP-binding protein [Clostridium tepidum]|uniref:Iron ABC transporter ATP-binding protein n=2 Tax=Clostridium tepidum TaxID=1962263 RepID=A0A1S9IHC6_9CLOT|nr:iron ABC transporter ATP-binding protein [Clostridium tepidum]OOO69605.1 iron ABC transporter ATP-binding protein [Clostridium tepidum]
MLEMLIKDIVFSYDNKKVIKGINLSVKEGEIVSIIGPNGSGKSTLLKCINGILKPSSGNVYIDSKEVLKMNPKDLAKTVAYVPQATPEVFLQTIFETVLMGRKPHLKWGVGEKDLRIVEEILEYMELSDLAECYIDELSGGQKQRVYIARALAQEPKILLLDEPTSSLDIKHQLEVLQVVEKISKQRKTSVVMVIHDLNLAYRFSDKLALVKNGQVVSYDSPDIVLTEENVNSVYEVESSIINTELGKCVLPINPIKKCRTIYIKDYKLLCNI